MKNSNIKNADELIPIQGNKVYDLVTISPAIVSKLDVQVDDFIKKLTLVETNSSVFKEKIASIYNLGLSSQKKSSRLSQRLLSRSLNQNKGRSNNQQVYENLTALKTLLNSLSPENNNKFFKVPKFLGFKRLNTKVDHYFEKLKPSQNKLNELLIELENNKDQLLKENIVLQRDKIAMWQNINEMEQYNYINEQLCLKTESLISSLKDNNALKAQKFELEILSLIKRKSADLLAQKTINVQTYMTIDLIQGHNIELIKNIDFVLSQTVTAFRTAVLLSNFLSNNKLTLNDLKIKNHVFDHSIYSLSSVRDQNAQPKNGSLDELKKLQSEFEIISETIEKVINSTKNTFKI